MCRDFRPAGPGRGNPSEGRGCFRGSSQIGQARGNICRYELRGCYGRRHADSLRHEGRRSRCNLAGRGGPLPQHKPVYDIAEHDFRFYNLLERQKVEFKPVKEGKARVCVTGPPLDQPLSIGDARRFLLADLLSRFFQAKNFSVDEIVLIPDFDSRTINSFDFRRDVPWSLHAAADSSPF